MAFSRRTFLKNGTAVVSAAAVMPPWLKSVAEAADSVGAGTSGKMLVIVELGGGNDGLNMVIPYQDGIYRDMRKAIGIDGSKALPLNDTLALHPSMAKMQQLYKSGKLAVIEGVGYPNPNRSHFRSMEIWQTANPEVIEYYGWLGKFLDAEGHFKNPLAAVSMGLDLPLAVNAQQADVPALESIEGYGLLTAGDSRQQALELYRSIHSQTVRPNSTLEKIQSASLEALKSSEELRARVKASQAAYPQNRLAQGLKEVARIFGGNVGTTVAYVRLGGFDTHAGQIATHNRLLEQVSESISAFWTDISARGLADKALLFTFSEFGRRVQENGGQGTDHGTAGPMFVLGNNIKPGIYGDAPDLKNLDNGDLKFQIDFRRVYATVLENWLDADSKAILGDTYKTLGFV